MNRPWSSYLNWHTAKVIRRLLDGVRFAIVTVLAAVAWPAIALAAGGENPFGLPVSRDPAMLGTVVLHGGGETTDAVLNEFLRLAGGKAAHVVVIPSGTHVKDDEETDQQFEARMLKEYPEWPKLKAEKKIADFTLLFTDNQTDADEEEFVKPLGKATGVWIPARYQGKLDWRFAPNYPTSISLFQRALRDLVARGGVVAGLGGGMAALPEIMILGDSGQVDGPAEAKLRHGLALLDGTIVDQNFDAKGGRLERFTGLLRDAARLEQFATKPFAGGGMVGLAVEQHTALLLRGNTVRAVGKGSGHVFLKSNAGRTVTWRTVASGEQVVVRKSSSADVNGESLADVFRKLPTRAPGPLDWSTNPFGLPEPRTPGGKPGTVVVHGGKRNGDLIKMYHELVDAENRKLVHCPLASGELLQPGESLEAAQRRLRKEFAVWLTDQKQRWPGGVLFWTVRNPQQSNDSGFVSHLKDAHAVWFSGGGQDELRKYLIGATAPTAFQTELLGVVARGGVVGGTSAGAAAMAQIMIEGGNPVDGRPATATVSSGFGLMQRVLIDQHFGGAGRGGRLERLIGLLRNDQELKRNGARVPNRMIGMAVEEDTALIVQQNRLNVFGAKGVHVFLKSLDGHTITWHALRPADMAFVREGATGPVLEIDDWQVDAGR